MHRIEQPPRQVPLPGADPEVVPAHPGEAIARGIHVEARKGGDEIGVEAGGVDDTRRRESDLVPRRVLENELVPATNGRRGLQRVAHRESRPVLLRGHAQRVEEPVDVQDPRRRREDRRRRADVRLLGAEARDRHLLECHAVLPASRDDLGQARLLVRLDGQEPLADPPEGDVVRLAERREAPVPADAEVRLQ